MFPFGKYTCDINGNACFDIFVSLLKKALPVKLKLFNIDCLKDTRKKHRKKITGKSTY